MRTAIVSPQPLASRTALALATLTATLTFAIVGVAPADAAGPWWHISSEVAPTNLPPGGEGTIIVQLSNLGDAPIDGSKTKVVTDTALPAGLQATSISGSTEAHLPATCELEHLSCSYAGILYPYEQLTISLKVAVGSSVASPTILQVHTTVEGGEAAQASATVPVTINIAQAVFGVASFALQPFNEDGSPATQAGSHPFELTTTLALNQTERQPIALPKDLQFHLPAGLVGNPTAVGECSMANFFALVLETNLCAPNTVVGIATVTANEPVLTHVFTKTVPVFSLVPAQGEPARFGFEVIGKVPIVIDTSVRSGGDYGVDVNVKDATETAGLLSSQVTLWGVPGDRRHDNARGWECVANGAFRNQVGKPCPTTGGLVEAPFLTLPTSCAAEPVVSSLAADSWSEPGSFVGAQYEWLSETGQALGFEGCGLLPFGPSIDVTPEEHTAATPTGLSVDVKVPQASTLEADGVAEADVRDTTVTLPSGVELSPSAANGLVGCPEGPTGGFEGVGFTGFAKYRTDEPAPETTTFTSSFRFAEEEAAGTKLLPSCPDGSKVGMVEIETPLLPDKLMGDVYLAEPAPNGEPGKNPFNSLVALYIVARDPVSGVLVKLAGEGVLDEGTLRVATVFRNAPAVPFNDLKLHLFGGPTASVTTPPVCGSYVTDGLFTPWSGTGPLAVQAPGEDFQVTSGVGRSACPGGSLPFSPGFDAFSTSPQAGGFTGFQLELTRSDGDQALAGVSMHLPQGVAALLSSVELCSEAQAATDTCPAGSEVGRATAVAGLGSQPYVQEGGRVFITGPYGGAPFGLEIVTPAKAGPFDLGYVTVRSKLYINPENASVTVVSDPLPTQIRGIPLQLKRVLVTVDRPGFEFNPTSCGPKSIEGTITGDQGATAAVSSPFQVGGCNALPFSPQLTASAVGHGSKAAGTTFDVTVRSGGVGANGVVQAGIAKVDLQLPKQLSSRLPTLQKACLETVFDANPASCPEGSVIGNATIHTPVLKNPLAGPAYLVSHGNAAFPDVEFVLQGENIKLVLDGKTQIKNQITYSKFETAPDAPFTVFETVLPAGPHSVLTPNVTESKKFNLCGENLAMPTTITAQDGAVIEQNTKIAITGCSEVKSAKTKKLTLAQQLQHALLSCRHHYKHAKTKRLKCEHQAHTHYTTLALTACRHQRKQTKKQLHTCEQTARKQFANPTTHRKKRG